MFVVRTIAALTLACTLAVSAAAQQKTGATASSDLLPFKVTEKTLANGLKVIIVPTGFPNIVSLQIPVQTGSRNEVEPGKSGFAHFFEHMMFRGTKKYPPEAYNAIITKAGARQNAYTTDDFTNYYITFAKDDLEKILEIEADRFQNLSYGEDVFKTESRAVLGEYNKNSANPLRKIGEIERNAFFKQHTYKHTTMGFIKDIEDMPNQYEYSKVFFDRWYRPENAAIIVAGDVTAAEVMPLIEKYWGGWKRGTYKAEIPVEPPPQGPYYAHIDWTAPTSPWVAVSFLAPPFSDEKKDYAAVDMLLDLYFGRTSDFYKKLVEQEQKADQVYASNSDNVDPGLAGIWVRVKDPKDALYVRDEVVKTMAKARTEVVEAKRLQEAKSNARYGFAGTLDNTDTIAATLARFVRYEREFSTLNNFFRVYDSLTPADLQKAAGDYFTDKRLVVTTLSKDALPAGLKNELSVDARVTTPASATSSVETVKIPSPLPLVNFKLLFNAGSAHDPKGKEGLAALSAAMIARAGSSELKIDEVNRALFPIAGSFDALTDKEMVTVTGRIHKDNWKQFTDIVLPMLTSPGFREDDFARLKDAQLNALLQDLRTNNEEELGKERLQALIFAGTPYEHPVLGTEAGIKSITIDDLRKFIAEHYTQSNVVLGVAGDAPAELTAALHTAIGKLPKGEVQPKTKLAANMPKGLNVDIIAKDSLATAISFGHPIEVTRAHPDFAALSVVRAWLGEHRSSMAHLYDRIREKRGMNYGDYAYIEAFPRGMFQFAPDANIARRAQIFEVWIRPVVPANAQMALRIALHELDNVIDKGMTKENFENTREYLMKNVYVLTSTQNHQLGYALDSKWYGIPEYTKYMRDALSKLTLDDVNRAIRKHLSADNLNIVMITKDATGLRETLLADAPSAMKYEAQQPAELLAEDKVIGARKLNLKPENVKITPAEQLFAK
jgi:zinc protease